MKDFEIVVRERKYCPENKFRCLDTYKKVKVESLAFRQGELFYFKKNAFDYLVVGYDHKEGVYYS